MNNLDVEGVSKKLAGMVRRLDRLSAYQTLSFEEYLQDEDQQASIERYLEVFIQAAIDINRMLINSVDVPNRETLSNADVFRFVGESGFISPALAAQLVPSAGFRNVLAHAYDDILPEMAYRALQLANEQYRQYALQILTYLNSLEEND
jgi:uncharacterized protein YutE (UPF0331/DUF86 family)